MPIVDILGPLMFLLLLILIFSGYPVAFSLGGTALVFAVMGLLLGPDIAGFDVTQLRLITDRIFDIMQRQTLLAVPFFIFMGTMLEKSRLAEDLLETIGQLFGPLRGGLAIAVVLVGSLLAATTGVVGATVTAMGLISLPVMLKYGYDKALISGTIAASGTLGQIIPPSVVLSVLGDQLGVSVGDLFVGAIIPGLMLSSFYIIYLVIMTFVKPHALPALPLEVRNLTGAQLFQKTLRALLPPLALVLVVLGSIFFGVATATEAGAIGSVLAMLLAALNRRLNLKTIYDTALETGKLTSMVVFILIGSTMFSLVFRLWRGDEWVQHFFTNLPGGTLGFMIASNLLIFILGFFIDFFEIVFIVIPLLLPAMDVLPSLLDPSITGWTQGDRIMFGIILGMNLQTSFLTPPFGFALFYLRGVAPQDKIKTSDIYRGVVPYIIIQVIALVLVIAFPQISQWLPNLANGVKGG